MFQKWLLYTAQPQVGGRISSIPWNDGYIETGAQFLHGLGSELAGYAKEKNFLSDIPSAEGEGLYLREDGTEIHNSIIKEINDDIIDVLEECQKFSENNENKFCDPSESIGTVLNKHFQKYLDLKGDVPGINYVRIELFDWYSRYLVIDNACQDLQNLSLKSWGKYKVRNSWFSLFYYPVPRVMFVYQMMLFLTSITAIWHILGHGTFVAFRKNRNIILVVKQTIFLHQFEKLTFIQFL